MCFSRFLPSPYLLSVGILLLTSVCSSQEAQLEFFESKIRPLLIDACLDCHGPDEQSGKLRLDSKAGWRRGGERGPAIVPGDPTASLLFQAVTNQKSGLRMPPADHAEPLTAAQIKNLEVWIRTGAVDPREGRAVRQVDLQAKNHWAFQPPTHQTPHKLAGKNPVDFFIDAGLKKHDLKPLPQADLRTLVRRATYDLTGLPPTQTQLELGKKNFDLLIDSLLASSHYGERWGRHWLDVARYSDAKDGVLMYGDARIRPFAYTYRDYVIEAFNSDLPFNDFVRHQLAADKMNLPENSPYLAAMGFLTLGRMFDRNRHDVIDDQIDVVSRGFLGLTASCARCHDHKFDPIPTADYYSLYGVFASTLEPLNRPRIGAITEKGQVFETELQNQLDAIKRVQKNHYDKTLQTARKKTKEYLVHVATTEPDYAETAIFFKSLTKDQLRPKIVHRWRKLIAKRAHSQDKLFAPWHDLFERHKLSQNSQSFEKSTARTTTVEQMAQRWKSIGVDSRLISALVQADPKTPDSIAATYGDLIVSSWQKPAELKAKLEKIDSQISLLTQDYRDLADIVAGGNGIGSNSSGRGRGIHPVTGKPTSGQAGFIEVKQHDVFTAVADNRFVDGVFVPKSGSVQISSSGISINNLPPTSGQCWDFFKFGPSNGSTENRINGIDYSIAPNTVLAMHANKGITFDLSAIRGSKRMSAGTFRALLGNSGAKGKSQIDFFVYVDGIRRVTNKDFASQSPGLKIEIQIKHTDRFLTLVATEGKQGISHDQVILGNPRIVFEQKNLSERSQSEIAKLQRSRAQIVESIFAADRSTDPLVQLLNSESGPVWFPQEEIYYYLSRQDKDAFRGMVNQVDSIAIKHKSAAPRAMILSDRAQLYDPVIFQRGDPGQKGNSVSRKFLELLEPSNRPFRQGSGRLELANAIASDQNPLTARVWVNRVWMHHFGEPLVERPSDFGLRTKKPVQLELLDFLATSLISSGWKTKPIHKLIMTSEAYRRASVIPAPADFKTLQLKDPENKLYWKFNRRRLDLEQMRDSILFVSGNLDTKMNGRPTLIDDPKNHRRTVYAFVERQNLPDIIQTFDSANADASTARRPNTIVPQQALFAMNSKFMDRQVKVLASRIDTTTSLENQIENLYDLIFLRKPSAEERLLAKDYAAQEGLPGLAHILLMTNEFMFVD